MIPALDGLRGLAILAVLGLHAGDMFLDDPEGGGGLWDLFRGGWMGVDLFFVVSGFLITRQLLAARDGGGDMWGALGRFWARRSLRILPLAWLYVSLLVAWRAWKPGGPPIDDLVDVAALYGFGANFWVVAHWTPPLALVILWSLAVEEQFYAVWPLVALFGRRPSIPVVLAGLIAAAPAWRHAAYVAYGDVGAYYLSLGRADALAWGGLIAWASVEHPDALRRVASVVGPPAAVGAAALFLWRDGLTSPPEGMWFSTFGYSVSAAALAGVVAAVTVGGGGWLGASPALGWAGRRCYGLYVWHAVCGYLVQRALPDVVPSVRALLWLAITAAVAEASWWAWERPFLRQKWRWAEPVASR